MLNLNDNLWLLLGFLGQGVFGARFVVQWLYSEYKKKSVIPVSFWYLSLLGSGILLAYSVHVGDWVFIAGFSLNTLIYIRNLMLIKRKTL